MAATGNLINGVSEEPWYAAYPAAKSEAKSIKPSDVLQMLKSDAEHMKDFVLVDLRRVDYEVSLHQPNNRSDLSVSLSAVF